MHFIRHESDFVSFVDDYIVAAKPSESFLFSYEDYALGMLESVMTPRKNVR